MIGIDTNVLMRLWLDDDPAQTTRIRAQLDPLVDQPQSVLINDITLCEAVWVAGSVYRFDKPAVLLALQSLLDATLFAFEDRATLKSALQAFKVGKADFADCLILARNRRLGCSKTLTFDKALGREADAQWLGKTKV